MRRTSPVPPILLILGIALTAIGFYVVAAGTACAAVPAPPAPRPPVVVPPAPRPPGTAPRPAPQTPATTPGQSQPWYVIPLFTEDCD